jgi:hypothetical protein
MTGKWHALGEALKGLAVLALLFAVFIPIRLTIERFISGRRFGRFIFGVDRNGEPFDRRDTLAVLIAIPVTFLLIRGWNASRKKSVDNVRDEK